MALNYWYWLRAHNIGWGTGKQGRDGTIDGTAGRDCNGWDSRQGTYIVESAESEKKDTAVGRKFFRKRLFIHGGYGGGLKR